MFENLDILRMASGLAKHAVSRQEIVTKNIANADTPGYRAKDIASFHDLYRAGPEGAAMKATRAGHIDGTSASALTLTSFDAEGASTPNGNTVSLETEMMKASQIRHQHDLALSVYKSSMNILRSSLGRR